MKNYLQVVLVTGEAIEYEWDMVDFMFGTIATEIYFTVREVKSGELLLCVPMNRLNYYRSIMGE